MNASERYTHEAIRLYKYLGRLTEGGVIEHLAPVGPASVPELGVSEPLEIALSAWPFPLEEAPRKALTELGYEPTEGQEGEKEQRFFHSIQQTRLSICEAGSDGFINHLIVRDYLRHSETARRKFLEPHHSEADIAQEAQRWWTAFHGFSPLQGVIRELKGFTHPWLFSSGWAIDLFLGRVTRVHHDIDVVIPRSALWPIKNYLNARGWQFVLPLEGRLEPWPPESTQEPDIQMHAHREGEMIDLLLTEMDDTTWHYRRDPRITCPASQAFRNTDAGLPYLAPELVLLFKSKNTSAPNTPRPQDEGDFAQALPQLTARQRVWLREALKQTDPEHRWLEALG